MWEFFLFVTLPAMATLITLFFTIAVLYAIVEWVITLYKDFRAGTPKIMFEDQHIESTKPTSEGERK